MFCFETSSVKVKSYSYIVRTGMTEVVDYLFDECNWSRSVPNLSVKRKCGVLCHGKTIEPTDTLVYGIVWKT